MTGCRTVGRWQYFGDLDETAAGDPDGDGVNNGNEYIAGTDPTQGDTAGPLVTSVAAVPNQVRQGVDASVALDGFGRRHDEGQLRT